MTKLLAEAEAKIVKLQDELAAVNVTVKSL